jgi:hypothetical protein
MIRSQHCNRPRLVDDMELLAHILHAELFPEASGAA